MKEYLVTWAIEVSADSPEEAADRARSIMTDGEVVCHQFYVTDDRKAQVAFDDFADDCLSVEIDENGATTTTR